MTDKELLDKAIIWLKNIADDMEHITSGNVSHQACATKGRAIRAAEFLEKHRNSLPEEPEFIINKDVSQIADEFAEREYELDGYERKWLSKGYYHGYKDASKRKSEEPVSEDLEEAMQHNAPNNIGIDELLYWRNGFIVGAQWQKEKDSILPMELGDYINELSKQFPEVSFAKLSRIAVRVAKKVSPKMWAEVSEDGLTVTVKEEKAV